jgi:hypothetical protein
MLEIILLGTTEAFAFRIVSVGSLYFEAAPVHATRAAGIAVFPMFLELTCGETARL